MGVEGTGQCTQAEGCPSMGDKTCSPPYADEGWGKRVPPQERRGMEHRPQLRRLDQDWTREANWLRGTTHGTGKTTHHECLEASASKAVSCPLTSSNSPGGEQEHSAFSAQPSQTTRPITHSESLHSTSIYCTSAMSRAMYFKHLWTNRHPPQRPPQTPTLGKIYT